MNTAGSAPLTVIYNGSCPICAREIAHYRALSARDPGTKLSFVDLTSSNLASYNLSPDAAARSLHVWDGSRLSSGIDAFLLIWARLPRFRWVARLAGTPIVRPVLDVAYNRIAAPWLYRRYLRRNARS
ncbi:MAG: DUF393 domain-containing protein [Pseudomonadota bacterium]